MSDLIGKVTLSDGREIDIHMPTMAEVEPLFKNPERMANIGYQLAAISADMTVEELRALSLVDGLVIMQKVHPAIESMLGMLGGGSAIQSGDET